MFFDVNKVFMKQRKHFSRVKTRMGAQVCAGRGDRYPALDRSNHTQQEEKSFVFSKWGTGCSATLCILKSNNIIPRRNHKGKRLIDPNTQIFKTSVLNITKLKIYIK